MARDFQLLLIVLPLFGMCRALGQDLAQADTTTYVELKSLTKQLPSEGERFIVGLRHGSMRLILYSPFEVDKQEPHLQDELYIIASGTGEFVLGEAKHPFKPNDAFFVPAGMKHRFINFSPDFSTWVIFYGPKGGEKK